MSQEKIIEIMLGGHEANTHVGTREFLEKEFKRALKALEAEGYVVVPKPILMALRELADKAAEEAKP